MASQLIYWDFINFIYIEISLFFFGSNFLSLIYDNKIIKTKGDVKKSDFVPKNKPSRCDFYYYGFNMKILFC
jgi:hypothetical protein